MLAKIETFACNKTLQRLVSWSSAKEIINDFMGASSSN